MKAVTIGGGTGLFTLLSGLKKYDLEITAIVSVSDNGGSSGKLRTEMGILPPGDIRRCLIALAEEETSMYKLFQHRFNESVNNHSLGNLILAALTHMNEGDMSRGIKEAKNILKVKGDVIPVTIEDTTICATLEDGNIAEGEVNISRSISKEKKIFMKPEIVKPTKEAVKAILEAEFIIIGPGSLLTSIIPNFLVTGIKDAIKESKAKKVYVCNVMTQKGESEDNQASTHLKKIEEYLGENIIDLVIANKSEIEPEKLKGYEVEGAYPVIADEENISIRTIKADMIKRGEFLRHDPDKLAWEIVKIMKEKF